MAERAHTDGPKRPPDSLLSDFQPTPKGLGRGRQKKRPEVATCGGCGRRWIGDEIAHCPRCHETFTDAAAFDTHVGGDYRSGLACLKPKSVGLSSCDGIWSTSHD